MFVFSAAIRSLCLVALTLCWAWSGVAMAQTPKPPQTPARPPVAAPPPVVEPLAPGEAFERGRIAFDRGEYARAIELLRPQLYPDIRFDEESQVVRSHRMLAVAHLFEGQPEKARQEFLRLLELRPDYRFDPLLDPPRIVDFFNEILREQEAQIAALEQRRRKAEDDARREAKAVADARVVERQFVRNSTAVALIPFGAGQFQNGHNTKAWAFLTSEAILASVSVAAFTTNFLLHGASYTLSCQDEAGATSPLQSCDPSQIDRAPERLSNALLNVQLVSGGLFFAVAAWGIVDALIYMKPLVPLEPTPRSAGPTVSLMPMILGTSPAPGMSIRF